MNTLTSFVISILLSIYAMQIIPFDQLSDAFQRGDARYIMNNVENKVLITVMNKERVYSPSQGEQVLKKFFESNPADAFNFNHKGKEKGVNSFAIGTYKSGNKSFRVSLKFKLLKENYSIESIAIE